MNQHVLSVYSEKYRGRKWEIPCVCTPGGPGGLTVGAQQALKLGEQPNGIELPQEAGIVQAGPQLDDEATDESGQLWGTDTSSHNSSGPVPLLPLP